MSEKIDEIALAIKYELEKKISDTVGLWVFFCNDNLMELEHWAISPIHPLAERAKQILDQTTIPYGEGSISYALFSQAPTSITSTSEDPRSTVSLVDFLLRQKSAYCYPVTEEVNGKTRVRAILDFYHQEVGIFECASVQEAISAVVRQHEGTIVALHRIRQLRELNRQLTHDIPTSITTSDQLLEYTEAFVRLLLPAPIIEFKSELGETNVVFSNSLILTHLRRSLQWCSYESSGDAKCHFREPFGFDGSHQCSCLVSTLLRNESLEYDPSWHQARLDSDYTLWFRERSRTKNKSSRSSLESLLLSILHGIEGSAFTTKEKDDILIGILASCLDGNKHLVEHLLSAVNSTEEAFQLCESHFKDGHHLKDEVAFLVLCRREIGYRWDISDNQAFSKYLAESAIPFFAMNSTLQALYRSLSDRSVLETYKPVVSALKVMCKVKDDGSIGVSIPNRNQSLSWTWHPSDKDKVICVLPNREYIEEILAAHMKNKGSRSQVLAMLGVKGNPKLFPEDGKYKEAFSLYPLKTAMNYDASRELYNEAEAPISDPEVIGAINTRTSRLYVAYREHLEGEQAKRHALNSALATIMARNMSHNIGSHVLLNLEKGGLAEDDLRHFIGYLRSRMDFLAQVSTEWPFWSLPTRFLQDLMAEFLNQPCIVRYIAASEGINETNLRLRFEINGCCFEIAQSNKPLDLNDLRERVVQFDLPVSIVGGVTGRQALYVILENFIRNAAKHSYKDKSEPLEITIKVEDTPSAVCVKIWDNVSEGKELHRSIIKKLWMPIIKESGELDRSNWGIAEMKISSAFLQKADRSILASRDGECLNVLRAEKTREGFLSYTFSLPKPKEVGIWDVGSNPKGRGFAGDGINFQNVSRVEIDQRKFDADHEFLLIIGGEAAESSDILHSILEKINLEILPCRLFFWSRGGSLDPLNHAEKRIVFLSDEPKNELESIVNAFIDVCKNVVASELDSVEERSQQFKLALYILWLRHLRDVMVGDFKHQTAHLYINLRGSDSNGAMGPYVSEHLKTKYPYLVPLGIHDSGSLSDAAQIIWLGLNEFIKDDPLFSGILGSISFDKVANWGEDGFLIAYPRHSRILPKQNTPKIMFREELSGASPHFGLLASPPRGDYMQKKLCLWMVENGLLRVAIADERIVEDMWNSATQDGDRMLTHSRIGLIQRIQIILRKGNAGRIFDVIPNRGYVWSEIEIGEQEPRILIDGTEREFDALIIHQGILDKIGEVISDIPAVISGLKQKIPFVFVTSGRGKPDTVPPNSRYVPFSDVQHAFSAGASGLGKMILTHVLMNVKN